MSKQNSGFWLIHSKVHTQKFSMMNPLSIRSSTLTTLGGKPHHFQTQMSLKKGTPAKCGPPTSTIKTGLRMSPPRDNSFSGTWTMALSSTQSTSLSTEQEEEEEWPGTLLVLQMIATHRNESFLCKPEVSLHIFVFGPDVFSVIDYKEGD